MFIQNLKIKIRKFNKIRNLPTEWVSAEIKTIGELLVKILGI